MTAGDKSRADVKGAIPASTQDRHSRLSQHLNQQGHNSQDSRHLKNNFFLACQESIKSRIKLRLTQSVSSGVHS